jgi:hypothetical protein
LELRVPATFVVLTLEKAYSEPATINALKWETSVPWCPTFQTNTKIFVMKY